VTQIPKNGSELLAIDEARVVEETSARLREILSVKVLNRRGFVVAMSGGIDSSVSAALAVEAIGAKRVYGLLLPEIDSSKQSEDLGRTLAEHLGITYESFDIAPALKAIGCYEARDSAIRQVVPTYDHNWKSKLVIAGGHESGLNRFRLVVEDPDGEVTRHSLPLGAYQQIVAATNYKQRLRKTIEYFHADRLNYAVVGTPNRLEYDQGFFVKNGDGSADVKPIAHLYKTQVYALARWMGLPDAICNASPTTDTYSMPQSQEEFYFALPYDQMDLALYAYNANLPPAELACLLGATEEQAALIYRDIEQKRRATAYLHRKPVLVKDVPNVGNC
jgi:NAD+ synthase